MLIAPLLLAAAVDLSSELKQVPLPATQAAVVNRAGIVAHGAAGAGVGDAFHIGSCTKPFTATMVAMLVEADKLGWQTRIADVFDGTIRPEYRDVTIADLLSHESGLPAFEDDQDFAALPQFSGNTTEKRRAFARHVLTLPPAAPRGTFLYSNAGFVVAAAIAEQASGRSWEWWMRERIFGPLHMTSAGFGWPAQVWGHDPSGKAVDPKGPYRLPDYLAPAGDLHMSADDLAAFLRMHLRAMRGELTLISPTTAAAMHTKRTRSALGFGSSAVAGFEHVAVYSGSADTFFTVIGIAADGDVAVAVSTNAGGETAQTAVGTLLKELLARYGKR